MFIGQPLLLDNFLLFPMEWCKLSTTTLPARFTHCVDDKWDNNDNNTTDDKDCNPRLWIARRDLCWRDKAQNKGEQGATEAKTCDNPHRKVATEAEWTVAITHTVAQNNSRRKEHHIHYKVERGGHL